MTWKCRLDCRAECCGVVPIPKATAKRFEHLRQRKVTEILEWSDDEIYPLTEDLTCVFLTPDRKCAIYDNRPDVCRRYGIDPELPCPYVKQNGNLRSPAQARRMLRQIDKEVTATMQRMESMG